MGYNSRKIVKNAEKNYICGVCGEWSESYKYDEEKDTDVGICCQVKKKDYIEWSDGTPIPMKRLKTLYRSMQHHHMSIGYIQKIDYVHSKGCDFVMFSSPIERDGNLGWAVTQELLKQIIDDYETTV